MQLRTIIPAGISLGKSALYRFPATPASTSSGWAGREGTPEYRTVGLPLTDPSYWSGRYALCELLLRTSTGEELIIPDAVVAMTRSKQIVTTQVIGMSGTVKEYISDGDYDINIAVGIASLEDGKLTDSYPSDELRELRAFLEASEPITVQSAFFDIFEINRIVIRSYSITQSTESNYQDLTISALSDDEYNVYSTDY